MGGGGEEEGAGVKIEELHPLGARTLVLVGKTGNGKSSTGNSILGRKAFVSKLSSAGVTTTAELQTTVLKDGQVVNVIDTPGLFDFKVGYEASRNEIIKCLSLAQDGFHALLLVLSVTNRFSEEEAAAVGALQAFFGPKITDFMIVVFTRGDELEESDQSLDDYLNEGRSEPLKKVLELCKNRRVLFDNRTKDQEQKQKQLDNLLVLVDKVVDENGGCPYTDSMFTDAREAAEMQQKKEEANGQEVTDQMQKSYDEQLQKMAEMIEAKLKAANEVLVKEVERERAAREKAEKDASEARKQAQEEADKRSKAEKKLNEEHHKLEMANRELHNWRCTIM